MNKEEALKNCRVEGNVVKLPDTQLDRKVYGEVKKALELIGGKWKGGKVFGFVFSSDPTELLESIQGGEKRNLQKEYQFFATPPDIADYLVSLANINATHATLEPSAGQGAIIKAIHREIPDKNVFYYELMDTNQLFLNKLPHSISLGDDFLAADSKKFDRIIANPPFSKNQDIIHLRKMFDILNPGGKLVCITSKHWQRCDNKKEKEFRAWLEKQDHEVIEIKEGSFKESGTMVGGLIVIIDK